MSIALFQNLDYVFKKLSRICIVGIGYTQLKRAPGWGG